MGERTGAWSLVLHGGAKTIVPAKAAANRAGLIAAAQAGAAILRAGGSALDAVEESIRSLEDAPIFNAGYGSVLNADGAVEMDAALMDGTTLDIGAVGALQGVRHPISVARALLRETPILLVAEGARRFAEGRRLELCEPSQMISREAMASEAGVDTVGCVARDANGVIAAGTSTGGLTGKAPGRVGDSPIPGCGLYADTAFGGVSASGDGEKISRVLLATRVMRSLEQAEPSAAAADAIRALERVGGEAGCIVLDREGRIGCAHNSDHFAMGAVTSWMREPMAFLHQDELREALDHG